MVFISRPLIGGVEFSGSCGQVAALEFLAVVSFCVGTSRFWLFMAIGFVVIPVSPAFPGEVPGDSFFRGV